MSTDNGTAKAAESANGGFDWPFLREDVAYVKALPGLLRDHLGKFALLHEDQILVFDDYGKAVFKGMAEFGPEQYLIRQIGPPDEDEILPDVNGKYPADEISSAQECQYIEPEWKFHREDIAYVKALPGLLRDHLGKFALIHHDQVLVFDDFDKAIFKGVIEFGPQQFVLRQIAPPEDDEILPLVEEFPPVKSPK